MATRRRIGVSIASTEAARRQLMQPVPCWERILVPSDINANIKVYKWVKTDKIQHFSDDEDADEPLAPLPDEPEIVEGDEDMDQDEAPAQPAPQIVKDTPQELDPAEDVPSKAPSPKPQLTMPNEGSAEAEEIGDLGDALDASLKPVDVVMNMQGDEEEEEEEEEDKPHGQLELNMTGLGPDGLPLEEAHDLSQIDPSDSIAGGNLMDQSGDPFAPVS